MNQIPSVDLKDFLSEDLEKKSNFVKSIGEAFQKIGFWKASPIDLTKFDF